MVDVLLAVEALLSASGQSNGAPPLEAGPTRPRQSVTFEAVDLIQDLDTTIRRELSQQGVAVSPSVSLGSVRKHPRIGLGSPSDFQGRSSMLAGGKIETGAAAAIVLSMLAEAAVATVRGVGPWEHDLASLVSEPPPSEIARAVALAATGQFGGATTPALSLRLHVPLFLDVSPVAMERLFVLCGAVAADVLQKDETDDPSQMGLVYSCLSLLRLLKVHLHYVGVCRLSLGDLNGALICVYAYIYTHNHKISIFLSSTAASAACGCSKCICTTLASAASRWATSAVRVFAYIYMHIYICIHMYVRLHMSIYIYIHIYIYQNAFCSTLAFAGSRWVISTVCLYMQMNIYIYIYIY